MALIPDIALRSLGFPHQRSRMVDFAARTASVKTKTRPLEVLLLRASCEINKFHIGLAEESRHVRKKLGRVYCTLP